MTIDRHLLGAFEAAALSAGKVVLDFYHRGTVAHLKPDMSPVTEADTASEQVILAMLAEAAPAIPLIAEEAIAAGKEPEIGTGPFILIDPLDGTKEFVNRNIDFTVNIALIEEGVPMAGVVYAPARGVAYIGAGDHAEKLTIGPAHTVCDRRTIMARIIPAEPIAVCSRSHGTDETDAFLRDNALTTRIDVGSSLKFCLLAEGSADVYPRFGRTMQWDTAAGDAVLRAAGGMTLDPSGNPLAYGRTANHAIDRWANPPFVAWGRRG